jgi:hypothetical protein
MWLIASYSSTTLGSSYGSANDHLSSTTFFGCFPALHSKSTRALLVVACITFIISIYSELLLTLLSSSTSTFG